MHTLFQAEVFCLIMLLVSCGLLLLGFPVAFTLAGSALLFAMIGYQFGVFDWAFISAFPQRIFAVMTNEVLVAVPLFVFMGVMLERSRIAEDLLDNMGKLFGSMRGGLGISVCLVGALLAASTGIVGATVVTMGLISLPTMLRRGYDPALACGAIAASGTLGQIIPPSLVLVLLGDQLSAAYQKAQFEKGIFSPETVSVNDLFAGALLPGLVLVGFYLLYQGLVAWLKPASSPAIPKDELAVGSRGEFVLQTLRSLVAPVLLIVAVLGSILGGLASPTEAASVGAVGALMLAGYQLDPARGRMILMAAVCMALLLILTSHVDLRAQRNEVSTTEWLAIALAVIMTLGLAWGIGVAIWRTYQHRTQQQVPVLASVVRSTAEITSMVFVILVGAAMFSLVFRGFGGDAVIENFLKDLPGGTASAVITVMLVMFLLGFFLDFLEIVFIVVPIVAPILLQMDVAPGVGMSPVWLGIMMGLVLQTSFLTPPFGFSLFYLRGVAPASVKTTDIYRGVIPFVSLQIVLLVVLWYWPNMATWLPTLLYN